MSLKPFFKSLIQNRGFVFSVYLLLGLVSGIQCVIIDSQLPFVPGTYNYIMNSSMNNYAIYQDSFYHLLHHQSLYGYYWSEHWDLYLYSPSFPLLIMPFAVWIKAVGVTLWCVFNALILFFAIGRLSIDTWKKTLVWWFVIIEMLTSLQNVQVNPAVAALFVLSFVAFEKRKPVLAALIIVASMYIKLFGIVGASLFVLYPDKLKFLLWCAIWSLVIFLLPLFFISFDELINQYKGWWETLINLHSENEGDFSAMQLLSALTKFKLVDFWRYAIQGIAVVLFCIKYIRHDRYSEFHFRYLFLASILIWCTIFNNAVESPSFIIAITGIAIWFVSEEGNWLNSALLIFAFVLTSLSHSDLMPKFIQHNLIDPYVLKCLPCLIIWILIEYRLINGNRFSLQNANG